MKLQQFVSVLENSPTAFARFVLPDRNYIPPHAHVTEVGHLRKKFIDCGGAISRTESIVLQTHVGNDTNHRLTSGRLASILTSANQIIPQGEFDVEIEYDCCVISQYPIWRVQPAGEHLDILLGRKRTQCLPHERAKRETAESYCPATSSCC